MANLLISRLNDNVLGVCVRRLPVHPRPFATTARAGKRLQRAVEAAREELGEQVCEEHGLESARGEAAGKKLVELTRGGATAGGLLLMVAGAPLDLQYQGRTALMEAACRDHTEIAKALIGAGAGLDLQNRCGQTALMLAAYEGHTETALTLIGAGAGLDLLGDDDCTALMEAAWKGHTEIALALVAAGAGLDLQDEDGMTALMKAANKGYTEIALSLIGAGAGLDQQENHWGRTALIWAAMNGHTEIAAALKGAGAAEE